jgi:hypothetical protein
MANICFNYITIFGNAETIKEIKAKYFEDIYNDNINDETETELIFSHESRWSPPEEWVQEMSCYGVTVECEYDECGADMAGKFSYANGMKIFEIEFRYLEGMYHRLDWHEFIECEVFNRIEDNEELEEFLSDFEFVTDEEREELITIFNEGIN